MYFHNTTFSMNFFDYVKPHISFLPLDGEKMFYKVKERETKEEKRNMYFQFAEFLICMFSYVNVNVMYIFICTFAVNQILYVSVCHYVPTPSTSVYDTILFVCHFLPPFEDNEGILCLPSCASSFVHLSASVSLTFYLHQDLSP